MDAGGDEQKRGQAQGVSMTHTAPMEEAWGPHAVAESVGEAGDSDSEYALIPVEEEEEEDRAQDQQQGQQQEQQQEKFQEQQPVKKQGKQQQQQGTDPALADATEEEKAPPVEVEVENTAVSLPDASTAAPATVSPDAADAASVAVVSQDPDAAEAQDADADAEEPGDADVQDADTEEPRGEARDADTEAPEDAEPSPAPSPKREIDRRQHDEEAIELSLVMSDSSVEPATVEAAEECVDVKSPCSPSAAVAEAGAAVQSNGTSTPPPPESRRKRKRNKKTSYSNRPRGSALARLKLEGARPPPVAVLPEQSDHAHGKKRHLDPAIVAAASVSPGQGPTFLYPATPTGTAWQWASCDMYFAPVRQENLDDLERIRKSQANFVAANPQLCLGVQAADRAQLDAMAGDASDLSSARLQLNQRRGRFYRDVWEEEDVVAAARRKLEAEEDADVPEVVQSNRDLVFGYDDDLFRDYVARLESVVASTVSSVKKSGEATPTTQPEAKAPPPQRTAGGRRSKQSSSKRDKKAARPPPKQVETFETSPLDGVLPLLPCHELHPASMGWWKIFKDRHPKPPSFSVIHPASMSRDRAPVRWIEEAEAYRTRLEQAQEGNNIDEASESTGDTSDTANGIDEANESKAKAETAETTATSASNGFQDPTPLQLMSFGDGGREQDEISRAIAASAAKLVPLSMANWRALQTVYERAACAQQCASIFDTEAAVKKSLEHLYTSMFAPPPDQQQAVDNYSGVSMTGAAVGRDRQPVSLNTRPRDLIAFSSRSSLAGDDASMAVAASVEFAMTLQMGDIVDVLDRTGCWNDGVVLDMFAEGGQYPKFVLVRLSLWSHEVVEWVGVSEGRLLPRGVAGGKMEFVLSRSQFRGKKLTLTRQVAQVLEQSFPQRRARLAAAAQREAKVRARLMQVEESKAMQKRKRKRAATVTSVVV